MKTCGGCEFGEYDHITDKVSCPTLLLELGLQDTPKLDTRFGCINHKSAVVEDLPIELVERRVNDKHKGFILKRVNASDISLKDLIFKVMNDKEK